VTLLGVISGSTEPVLKIILPIESDIFCECHRHKFSLIKLIINYNLIPKS